MLPWQYCWAARYQRVAVATVSILYNGSTLHGITLPYDTKGNSQVIS